SPSIPSYPTGGGVKNHFPNDGLPKKDLFEGGSAPRSSFENTYNFGEGNTLRSTRSFEPKSGTITTGLESSWANGNRQRFDTSTSLNGSHSSRSDNTYNFGSGNTLRSARSYDSATGATDFDSTQTWGNGNSTRTISGQDAAGRSYNFQANTYNWGSGKTSTVITGTDADGNYVNKTITK
ncbi:MAG TPA: hypothetical protein PLX89_01585, partial [Verrucomicrobiota bacterium]|nr:hypothetical protein [Verrucomicrobiota bacterium]